MSNQRPSFAKRNREMKLKDKARAKAERRAARRAGAMEATTVLVATDREADAVGTIPSPSETEVATPPGGSVLGTELPQA